MKARHTIELQKHDPVAIQPDDRDCLGELSAEFFESKSSQGHTL